LHLWGGAWNSCKPVALNTEKASTFELNDNQFSALTALLPHHGLSSDLIGMGHAIQQAQEARIMSTGTDEPQAERVREQSAIQTPKIPFTIHPSILAPVCVTSGYCQKTQPQA
jgi:hypothetical protein